MERLTSPNINVDPGTDRFLHAAIGGKEIDWKQNRDSTLNVMINGPTSNGFGKDIFRKMARDLYGRLKAYEDTGLEPEAVETVKLALCAKHMVDLETLNNTPISRLVELAEADKDGRVSVLPCKPGADMINKILPGSTYLMERVHFAVAYVNKGNIYLMTQRAFEEGVKNGTIVSAATERAMEGRKDG
jgi:hypothetical protein